MRPDFGYWGSSKGKPYDLYENGLIRGMPKEMVRANMPHMTKTLDEHYPLIWQMMFENQENADEWLSISTLAAAKEVPPYMVTTRVDWARKVGIEFPGYEEKKIRLNNDNTIFYYPEDLTIDWLERLLVAYRDGDPDGNGKIDTIPWGGDKDFYWMWLGVDGGYGWTWGPVIENGELTSGEISNSFKEWCKLAAKWYGMGLIDKEFATNDRTKLFEKVEAGIVAAVHANMGYIDQGWAANRPPNSLVYEEKVAEGAEAICLPPIIGPIGERAWRTENPVPGSPQNVCMAGTQVSDEKLEVILQILDYVGWDPEYYVESRWGLEGVHFDWEGEPGETRVIPRAWEDIPDGYPKIGVWPSRAAMATLKSDMKYTQPLWVGKFTQEWLIPNASKVDIPIRFDLFNDPRIAEVKSEVGASLSTFWRTGSGIDAMVQEFYAKAMVGEIDIDEAWDEYVAKWRKAGGDKLIEAYKLMPLMEPAVTEGKLVY